MRRCSHLKTFRVERREAGSRSGGNGTVMDGNGGEGTSGGRRENEESKM